MTHSAVHTFNDSPYLSGHGEPSLLAEDSFQQILALEKKRSERSGNPVLLMRLKVKDDAGAEASRELLSHLSAALFAVTRETDIKGWYAGQLILGVLYTEIGSAELQEAKDTITRKVDEHLCEILTEEQRRQVEIAFDSFLGKTPQQLSESVPADFELYRRRPSPAAPAVKSPHALPSLLSHWGILVVGDVVLVSVAWFLGDWVRTGASPRLLPDAPEAFATTLALVLAGLFIFNQYRPRHLSDFRQTLTRTALALCLAAFGGAALSPLLAPEWRPGHHLFALEAVLLWVLLAIFRLLYARLLLPVEARVPALVLGNGNLGRNVCQLLNTAASPYEVRGCLVDGYSGEPDANGTPAVLGGLDQIGETAAAMGIHTLIVALPSHRSQHIVRKILEARLNGITIVDLPNLYERLTGRLPLQYLEEQWLLVTDSFSLLSKAAVQRCKRLMDLICSGLLLLVTLPVAAVVALAIRLDSIGPVFYQEERVGKNGRLFLLWNFRSMYSRAAEKSNGALRPGEPLTTRVGLWLRRFGIDQLPQIWNVFKGDMSLVGPAAERPELARELHRQIPYYSVRHTVPPGITGWARIKYPYGATIEDALCRLEYDLYYVKNMSIHLDLKILVRTIGMALLGEAPR